MSQFLRVAETAIRTVGRPMTARELYDYGRDNGLFSDAMSGLTPWQTMKSKLSVHIRSKGNESIFVRTSPGHFFIRDLLDGATEKVYESHPWRPPPSHERVVVFHRNTLNTHKIFQGILTDYHDLYRDLFHSNVCFQMDRAEAESDNDHKQILTYIMVTRGDDILSYQRGRFNRTEDMLRGLNCVGFGGHVNAEDYDLFAQDDAGIYRAAARELNEELRLPRSDQERLATWIGLEVVGLLNDDSSPVGRRHFAVVLRYEVSDDSYWDDPQRGEKSINQLRWVTHQSGVDLVRFEYWSQLVLRTFSPRLTADGPSFAVVRRRPFILPHVMCVVGPIGSGKTEAVQTLRDEFGYVEINSGKVLARLLDVPPVPQTDRHEFQQLAEEFISTRDGPRLLARAIIGELEVLESSRVIIDGLRHIRTFDELRAKCSRRTNVVFVITPVDIAFDFYAGREVPDVDFLTFAEIRESPVESDVPRFLKVADAVLYNWNDKEQYLTVVRTFLADVGIHPA